MSTYRHIFHKAVYKMARQMLMMMWCVLTLRLLNPTDSALQLIVSPDTVTADLTTSLDINCTFSYQNPTNISNLVSLVVSKSDDDNNTVFQDLATINEFNPNQVNIVTPVNASVSGQISTVDTSYLSLQWAYPGPPVAGIYRCKAQGMNSVGQALEEDDTKDVTASKPGLDQLIDLVKLQQLQMDNMMNVLVSLTDSLASVDSKVSSLTSALSTLNNTVSDGMKNSSKYEDTLVTLLTKTYIKSAVYQDRYYLLSENEHENDRDAQASCLVLDGYLAEIDDVGEHDFIKTFLNSSAPRRTKFVMVGATDREQERTWVFSHSQQIVNYTDWSPGEPTYASLPCMYLKRRSDWSMANFDCVIDDYYDSFLCEIPTS